MNKINSQVNKKLKTIYSSYSGVTGTNYNAIFYFTKYTGELSLDEFGNYIPGTSELIEIKAQIHSIKPDYAIKDIGLNMTRDYYKAWFISPLTYPGEIPASLDCEILINSYWLKGKFTIVRNNISNQLENTKINKSLGYSIEGTFEQETSQRA